MERESFIIKFDFSEQIYEKSLVITKKHCTFALANAKERDVAQPGRVRVWGACGRKFESCHPDSKNRKKAVNQPFSYFIFCQNCFAGTLSGEGNGETRHYDADHRHQFDENVE